MRSINSAIFLSLGIVASLPVFAGKNGGITEPVDVNILSMPDVQATVDTSTPLDVQGAVDANIQGTVDVAVQGSVDVNSMPDVSIASMPSLTVGNAPTVFNGDHPALTSFHESMNGTRGK